MNGCKSLETGTTHGAPNPQPLVLSGHTRTVYSIGFLPDSNQFVSGSVDGTVRTWGTTQAREVRSPIDCRDSVSTMAVSNDGRWIATSGEKWRVTLWDATTHQKVGESANAGVMECLSFSNDVTRIVSGCGDTTIIVWSIPTCERFAGPFRGHIEAVTSVVFSPEGNKLASTDGGDIRIWDSLSGTRSLTMIDQDVRSLVWASAPNDGVIYAACADRIRCFDPSTGATYLEWTAHALIITSIVLSRDGQLIASSSNYGKTVRLWNTATQQECAPVLEHASYVRCVAISPNGTHVVSGGDDHTVYIWPIQADLARVDETASRFSMVRGVRCGIQVVERCSKATVAVDDDHHPESTTTSTSLQDVDTE